MEEIRDCRMIPNTHNAKVVLGNVKKKKSVWVVGRYYSVAVTLFKSGVSEIPNDRMINASKEGIMMFGTDELDNGR